MMMKHLFAGLLCLGLMSTSWAEGPALPPLEAVSPFVVNQYTGRWFEISKFPNVFQRQCVAATTATYTLQKDGRLEVRNRCELANGGTEEAVGQARIVGEDASAKLKVRFAPEWLSFLPMVWADYWVVDIDYDYQLAAVSEPKREYLWILSRTPKVDETKYQELLKRLQAKGFDIHQLRKTPQPLAKGTPASGMGAVTGN